MKNIIYLIFIALALQFLFSCGDALSTRIEIDPPEFEERMTLTSFIDAYTVQVNMFIGTNRSIFDTEGFDDYGLEGARLVITKASDFSSLDSDIDGISMVFDPYNYSMVFTNSNFFEPGEQYTFNLDHPDYMPSVTTLDFPNKGAVLEDIVYKREDGLDEEFEQASSITFDIVDDPAKNDFYELEASTVVDGFGSSSFWISTLDPVGRKGRPNDNILISDETFNGERKRIKIKFDRELYDSWGGGFIELKFRTVNEGYYKNSISLAKYYDTNGTPFTSPVQIHSNLDGALGNISFKTTDIYIVE